MKLNQVFCILFLFFISFLMMFRQLIADNFFSITIDDTYTYTSWASQFREAIKEGIIYPRWMPLNFWGYGSPTFLFYPPLTYYLVSLFSTFNDSIISAMNMLKFVSLFLSGVGMFFLVKAFYPIKIAFLSGAFYIIFPHIISSHYVSGSFASTISFMWFSPIMFFIYRYFKKKEFKDLILAGACYGGLILTHLINAYMFTFVITGFVIYMAITKRKLEDIKAIIFILTTGFLVSAAYLIPLLYENQFINFKEFVGGSQLSNHYYANFFILPNRTEKLSHDNWFTVYYFDYAVYLLFYLVLLYWLYLQVRKSNYIQKKKDIALINRLINRFSVGVALFTIFLQFGISSFLWENILYFKYVQFPARWLNITVFFIIYLSAAGFYVLLSLDKAKKGYLMIALLFMLCVSIDFITISKVEPIKKQDLLPVREVNWTYEHLPAGVDVNKIKNDNSKEKVTITSGVGEIKILKWGSEERLIKIRGGPLNLKIRTFNFPGWEAEIEGERLEITTERDSGAMLINIPQGEHILRLRFKDTPVRYYGKMTTLFSVLALVGFIVFDRLKKISKHIVETFFILLTIYTA